MNLLVEIAKNYNEIGKQCDIYRNMIIHCLKSLKCFSDTVSCSTYLTATDVRDRAKFYSQVLLCVSSEKVGTLPKRYI